MKSNIVNDLKQEAIVANYLDKYFYNRLFNGRYKRATTSEEQFSGIDVIVAGKDGKDVMIDEKSQITRLNAPLPTFAFELSFFNKYGERKQGWFYKDNKTEYYLLVYFTDVDTYYSKKIADLNQIREVEVVLVDKNKLHRKMEELGIYEDMVQNRANQLMRDGIRKKVLSYGVSIVYTDFLKEKPLNLVINRRLLDECAALIAVVRPWGIEITKK